MVFNKKGKSAVKEKRIQARVAKKRCNDKGVHARKQVLVSGKRTGGVG
jgi:hypothetical protein